MHAHDVYSQAIGWIGRSHFKQGTIPSQLDVAQLVLKLALAHPKTISRWIGEFCDARDTAMVPDEKLHTALIAKCKEYRMK